MQHNTSDRALRLPEVCQRVGMSRTTVWRLTRDGKFPKPFRLSPRIIVWMESEISAYLEGRREDHGENAGDA